MRRSDARPNNEERPQENPENHNFRTAEQADCIYQLLGDLRSVLWDHYGDEIAELYEEIRVEQQERPDSVEVNHELPFLAVIGCGETG